MLETKALLEQKATSLIAKTDMVDELMEEMASIRVQLDSLNQVNLNIWNHQSSYPQCGDSSN